jgi:hypothetical protein
VVEFGHVAGNSHVPAGDGIRLAAGPLLVCGPDQSRDHLRRLLPTASGHYAADLGFFATSGFDHPPLHAQQSLPGNPDGVFAYGSGGVFPSNGCTSTQPCFAANYWADVIFATG